MKTVALFGGSFDPPHLGHVAIVQALKQLNFIDKIVVMPTYLNPFKSHFKAPATLRLQWLQEIFSDDERVDVSSFEVSQKRAVPAIESVEYLQQFYDKIYLVIGADNLASLTTWHRYSELKRRVSFIVATRNQETIPKEFYTLEVDVDTASSTLRESMDASQLPSKCAAAIQDYYKENNANKN